MLIYPTVKMSPLLGLQGSGGGLGYLAPRGSAIPQPPAGAASFLAFGGATASFDDQVGSLDFSNSGGQMTLSSSTHGGPPGFTNSGLIAGGSNNNTSNGRGGEGGTQSQGGDGGQYGSSYSPGTDGTLGVGGDGGANTSGGGGGGGYYGGGGGSWSGGGGGSSYANSDNTSNTTHTQGYNDGNGEIIVTW